MRRYPSLKSKGGHGRSWGAQLPGMGVALGAAIGVVVGVLIGRGAGIALGVVIGAALGLVVGAAVHVHRPGDGAR